MMMMIGGSGGIKGSVLERIEGVLSLAFCVCVCVCWIMG